MTHAATIVTALPAGQVLALLMVQGGYQGAILEALRACLPQTRTTPSMEDYAAIVERGYLDMRGGLHLTPAGACAAATVARELRRHVD